MDTINALSYLALLWPVLCSAQQSTSVVATLQLPDEIFDTTSPATAFSGYVTTSIGDSELLTAYAIPCEDEEFVLCQSINGYGQYLEFTAATHSTTYDLPEGGTIICGVTDTGPDYSGTALCTATAGTNGGYYGTPGVSYRNLAESSSYVIYFASMDEDLVSSLGATTTTYNPITMTASTAAPSITPSSAAASTPINAAAPSTSSPAAASTPTNTSAPATTTSFSRPAASTAQPTHTTGSHHLTEHEKIGMGVGIVAFVLVCFAAGYVLRLYRRKRRAANPNSNPSELYFNTDEKGQASGT